MWAYAQNPEDASGSIHIVENGDIRRSGRRVGRCMCRISTGYGDDLGTPASPWVAQYRVDDRSLASIDWQHDLMDIGVFSMRRHDKGAVAGLITLLLLSFAFGLHAWL